jgi:hypothetical protein
MEDAKENSSMRMMTLVIGMLFATVPAVFADIRDAQAPTASETLPCQIRSFLDIIEPVEVPAPKVTPILVNHRSDYIVTSLVTKGDEIDGPQRIVLLYINRLRYSFTPSVEVTIIQNPAVPAGFVATELAKGVTAPSGGTGPADRNVSPGFDQTFDLIRRCANLYKAEIDDIENDRRDRVGSIKAALNEIDLILKEAPAILSKPDAESLRVRAGAAAGDGGSLLKALEAPFPSDHARVVKDSMDAFDDFISGQEATAAYKEWVKDAANLQKYLALKAALKQGKATIDPVLPGKPADVEADTQQKRIAFWRVRFIEFSRLQINGPAGQPGVTQEDLALVVDTNCRTILGRGKSSSMSIVVTDLLTNTNQTVANVVKTVCQPLLSVSAGIGFSTLGDQTPAFVQSEKGESSGDVVPAVEQRFGYTEKSDYKPLFIVQTNVRLTRPKNGWSPVATFGIGATNRTATTVVEFLFGGGVSISSVAFVTAGLHIGKQSQIGGGFEAGDLKPPSLDTVPVDTGYRKAFAISLTFSLR